MNEHEKKMVAPIVVTVLMIIYYILYFGLLMMAMPGILLKLVMGIIPFLLAAGMIYVCIQRMNEIRSGEEDDISEY